MMHSNLVDLPDEILHLILRHSDPAQCLALERTSRRFQNVTNEPLLWRLYCKTGFRYWNKDHQFHEKLDQPSSTVDWKNLYAQRYTTDLYTTRALDDILSSQSGRIKKAQAIIDHGYDVKDTLLRHSRAGSELDDYLARRYYSNAIIECLQRHTAIQEWTKLRENENAIPLERALGCFDLFVPQCGLDTLDEIRDMLDGIASEFLQQNTDILNSTPRQKALSIASYLLSNNYTGIRAGREYHDLQHNFLGLALRSSEHNSLPLISTSIFCYVAQKFGLNSQPCGFPFHVLVIISPPAGYDIDGNALNDGSYGTPIYMDPWRSENEVPVVELQRQLNLYGASTLAQSPFLGETSRLAIVLRCGRNILNSLQVLPENMDLMTRNLDTDSAKYAGFWSLMLTTPQTRLMEIRRSLPLFMELFFKEFPWDISLVEQCILPIFQESIEYSNVSEGLRVMRAVDEMSKQSQKRSAEHANVKYKVGQVFVHRRYDYTAIITGWDAECGAGEEWMRRMGVDQLQAGRKQSFYHALVEDRSVRYVAEENIQITEPTMSELPDRLLAIAGKHFKRWSEEEHKFVSNMRDEYPDD